MTEEGLLLEKLTKIENDIIELKLLKKDVLNLDEACTYIQVSRSHMYKLTSKCHIPNYCPNGKKLYFKRAELDQWLTTNPKKDINQEEIEQAAANYMIRNPKRKGVAA
jgi:excisionase family DNA binding protein